MHTKPCAHGGAGSGTAPKNMTELVREKHHRQPQSGDWNDECEVCAGKESGNVFKCSHCAAVAHNGCIEREHWDLSQGTEDEWTCWECARDLDKAQHSSSCNECNEADFIVEDISIGIKLLAKSEKLAASDETTSAEDGDVRDARPSELLLARLQIFEGKQEQYHAHLIWDRNQACFKDLSLETLPLGTFYLLVDYWAKVSIGKAGGTACCEGDSVGLSAHGAMFVYRNPSIPERARLSLVHTDIDWSLFGPASDEDGGLKYLEEHFNAYCDDAKQNNFHTKSALDATTDMFLKARPWLRDARKGRMQSDNVSNYRDPTTEIDLTCIGTRCFSEAGMGKDDAAASSLAL